MGNAWVHTDAIERFAFDANRVRDAIAEIVSIDAHVTEIQDNINKHIRILQEQVQECSVAEERISEIVSRLQCEYNELNEQYQVLLDSEPPDPEEREVTITEYDEEGNLISQYTDTEDYESDSHVRWRQECDELAEERDNKYEELSQANSLREEIRYQIKQLNETIQLLAEIMAKNQACLDDLHDLKTRITEDSDHAIAQLNKAISALRDYLDVYVSTNSPTYSVKQIWDPPVPTPNAPSPNTPATNSAKRYGPPIIFEMDVTFTDRNHKKKTVHVRRQVYQYYEEIDFDYVRADGKTNRDAMLEGKCPVVIYQGEEHILELHHLIQVENNSDPNARFLQGGLVEIRSKYHEENTKVLHIQYPRKKGIRYSFRVIKNPDHKHSTSNDGKQFDRFREQYWKKRVWEHDQKRKE